MPRSGPRMDPSEKDRSSFPCAHFLECAKVIRRNSTNTLRGGHETPFARRGVMSATSPSLHICLGVNLPSRHARGPYAPDLPRIDPSILLGGGGETDVRKDMERRLALSRCRLAIARQRNPMAVVFLDGQVQVKVDATICSHSKIIDAVRSPGKAALATSINH